MLDLLITGGLIVDGSSSPGFYGAIGVQGDRVSILRGDVSAVDAKRVIQADRKVVCPGFSRRPCPLRPGDTVGPAA